MAKKSKEGAAPKFDDQADAFRYLVGQLKDEYGNGSVHTNFMEYEKIGAISTGSIALDCAIGIGGVPRGRVTEIYGVTSSGKSTLCTHIMTNAQKDGLAVYLDLEHAFDCPYAKKCGLDMDTVGKWAMSQPSSGEEAFGIAEYWLNQDLIPVSVICFDSVDKMQPKDELSGSIEDKHMMGRARLMSTGLHRIVPLAANKNVALVFTNQLRTAIGVGFSYSKTVGGDALPYYSSVRIELKNKGPIVNSTVKVGSSHHANIKKNKVGAPYGEVDFEVFFEEGISRESSILDYGVGVGVIEKNGNWYLYGEDCKLGHGKESAKQFLKSNTLISTDIERDILEEVERQRSINVDTGEIDGDDEE